MKIKIYLKYHHQKILLQTQSHVSLYIANTLFKLILVRAIININQLRLHNRANNMLPKTVEVITTPLQMKTIQIFNY